jgi:hypothetical protein
MPKDGKRDRFLKAREAGFDMSNIGEPLSPYDALNDPNMRHFFENRKVQTHLYNTGQIDRHGRVIDQIRAKGKLAILEREFREAQKVEERRYKEEMEMRYRVQRKRFMELERTRKAEILQKLKADHVLSKEILAVMKGTVQQPPKKVRNRNNCS